MEECEITDKDKGFKFEQANEDSKKRCWFITFSASLEPCERKLMELIEIEEARKMFKSITAQKEKGDGGYIHFHVLLEAKNQLRYKTIKDMFPGAHIAFVSGAINIEKARKYCSKEKTRIQGPWIIKDKQERNQNESIQIPEAKRTKLDIVYDMIANKDITKPSQLPGFIQMSSSYKYACAAIARFNPLPVIRKIKVLVLYNGSGYGKTTNARICFKDNYGQVSFSRGSQPWFDGYNEQDVLLIDEFVWGALESAMFKGVLSGDLEQLPIKGGFVRSAYSKIIITTNTDPHKWGKRGGFVTITTRNSDTNESISKRVWMYNEDSDEGGIIAEDDLIAIRRRLGLDPRADKNYSRCVNVSSLIHPEEKDEKFGSTPKTWRKIQEVICNFFEIPIPEQEEEEAPIENPVVRDFLGVSQSPPASSCASPDILAIDSQALQEIDKRKEEESKFFNIFLAKYEEMGFTKSQCEEMASELMKTIVVEANRKKTSIQEAAERLGFL